MIRDKLARLVGPSRSDGLLRLFIGVPFLVLALVVLYPVLVILAVLRAIVTIPLGIVLGTEISKNDDPTGRILWGLWLWTTDNIRWIVIGSPGPSVTPSLPRP